MAQSVGIIGAGIAGLSCGEALIGMGYNVTIFEKSRGLSGRSSTRKVQEHRFDHGAQFFTAKSDAFKNLIEDGVAQGVIATWQPKVYKQRAHHSWFVGTPGMSSLGQLFTCKHAVQINRVIEEIQFQNSQWYVKGMCDQEPFQASFDAIVLAIPSIQVMQLLHKVDLSQLPLPSELKDIICKLDQIEMLPCWSVLLSIKKEFSSLWSYDVYQTLETEMDQYPIAWLARNSSKPQRPQDLSTDDWVIQASPSWSLNHLEIDSTEVVQAIVKEMEKLLKFPVQSFIEYSSAHRWRYSRVQPVNQESRSIYSADNNIGFCGDYLSTSRIESAYLSGLELSHQFK